MKKILLALGLCAAFAVSSRAESYGSTNYADVKGPFYLMSGSGIVKTLTIIGGSVANTVALWDCTPGSSYYSDNGGNANGPLGLMYYTNAVSYTVSSTASSILTTNVTLGGITNIITNSVVLTAYTTNAVSTNSLCTKLGQWSVPASTVLTFTAPNLLFSRGLYATTTTTNAASIWVTTDTLR